MHPLSSRSFTILHKILCCGRTYFADTLLGMIERLERALAMAAYIVLRHGPVYATYIDRLERELAAARRNDPTERAKRILQTYTVEGGRKTIRSSHSRLCSSDGPTP